MQCIVCVEKRDKRIIVDNRRDKTRMVVKKRDKWCIIEETNGG